MIRKIVKIAPEKCNGCGLCISGCHEGALQLVDGKATLLTAVQIWDLKEIIEYIPMNP